jgi:hypothetical protein
MWIDRAEICLSGQSRSTSNVGALRRIITSASWVIFGIGPSSRSSRGDPVSVT